MEKDGEQDREVKHSLVKLNIMIVVAVIAFYFAYSSWTQGNNQVATVLAVVGVITGYLGLKSDDSKK